MSATCPDCSVEDLVVPVVVKCPICDRSPERCRACARKHIRAGEHPGIRLVRTTEGPSFRRVPR